MLIELSHKYCYENGNGVILEQDASKENQIFLFILFQ